MTLTPYVRPDDDVERAGLRDYLPRPAGLPRRRWTPAIVLLAFLLGLLAGVTLRADATPRVVTMTVRPQIMLQRGDIRVEVRVPRHLDNRLLSIAWSSDHGTEGSTRRPLDGEDAAVLLLTFCAWLAAHLLTGGRF